MLPLFFLWQDLTSYKQSVHAVQASKAWNNSQPDCFTLLMTTVMYYDIYIIWYYMAISLVWMSLFDILVRLQMYACCYNIHSPIFFYILHPQHTWCIPQHPTLLREEKYGKMPKLSGQVGEEEHGPGDALEHRGDDAHRLLATSWSQLRGATGSLVDLAN